MFFRLDGLWQARGPLLEVPLKSTSTDPPPGHPKGKQDGFTVPAAGHLSCLPSARRTWQARNFQPASGTREVSHGRKDTEVLCPEMPTLQSPGLIGIVVSSKLETPHSICLREISNGSSVQPSKEMLHELTAKSALENPQHATDLTASASQDHRPGITLDTHRVAAFHQPPEGDCQAATTDRKPTASPTLA